MKKKLTVLLASLAFTWSALGAVLIETKHFSELCQYVTPGTLVLLDIDDTLLIPVQTLGNDAWFQYHLQQLKTECGEVGFDRALGDWEAVRQLTQVKIVEEGTEKIVAELQKNHVIVMGLTTQGLALATCTVNQLNALNIDLMKTAPSREDHFFINQHGVLYRKGILFTSGTPKGPALVKLLDILQFRPEKIVFINDKASHLEDVETSMIALGIEFIGLRYSFGDDRVASFNRDIADIQWNNSTLNHILSDEEAGQILINSPS